MKFIKIEICCASADDVIEACKAGADRAELISGMFLGGLTPTTGSLRVAKRHAGIPCMCMIRPREGGFCYTDMEFETAVSDAHALMEAGADGLVFGFLREDGRVDELRCMKMAEIAAERETVFHRAIDVTPDWREALDTLMAIGITRVLTSGHNRSAYFGAPVIAEMIRYAAGRIQILPGAGITPDNASEVIERTGCDQLHMSMHKYRADQSTAHNPDINFGGALYPPEDRFKTVDGERLARFNSMIKG